MISENKDVCPISAYCLIEKSEQPRRQRLHPIQRKRGQKYREVGSAVQGHAASEGRGCLTLQSESTAVAL